MQKDKDYMDMKKWIGNLRDVTLVESVLKEEGDPEERQPNHMSNTMEKLDNEVLDTENSEKTITLDDNKTAKVISDNNSIPENVIHGLEVTLNGVINALQGTVANIELITVHVGDSSMVITIKVNLQDGQPATLHVDSQSQHVQMKYDNFFVLNDHNLQFIVQAKNFFNPRVMSQLQGAIETTI